MNAAFQWAPLLPYSVLALLLLAAVVVAALARWKCASDFYGRSLFFIVLGFLLLEPVVINEVRLPLLDKLVIVVDESPSENIAGRNKTAEKILSYIKTSLASAQGVEPVVIRAGQDIVSLKNQNTSLFSALKENLIGIPQGQVAGTVLITDGQVHDVPESLGALEKLAPFHVVLTGKKDEFDRKVKIVEAPKYGLLSQEITLKVKVEDSGRYSGTPIVLNVSQDGKPFGIFTVEAGEVQSYAFRLDHSGQNVFEFSVAAAKGEMTESNNTAAVIVNGVRDRLRVLLVSGMPHVGERAWRDLLKFDPSIDLVHFTILRTPMSFDSTPSREMSLIAFPVEELFQRRIRDFDLIIFDKYARYGLLQQQYFLNIVSFVKEGGAFLMALGSESSAQSVFKTPLGGILPVEPKLDDRSILSNPYLPKLTDLGKNHPITGDLYRFHESKNSWGRWLTQTNVNQTGGQVLMIGAEGRPLLIIDKVGKGRVAVLASDNIWLWSKGVDGGGPYTELLRHVSHWLMKEPELEEDFIRAEVRGNVITVFGRGSYSGSKSVTMTRPDGQDEAVAMLTQEKFLVSSRVIADQNGIYRFSNGSKTAFAIVGTAVGEEFSDVHTTEEKLKPVVDKTKGAMIWYSEKPDFSFRRMRLGNGSFGGRDWIGLKHNSAYNIGSVESAPLIPNWLSLLIILGSLLTVWWREGGKNKI